MMVDSATKVPGRESTRWIPKRSAGSTRITKLDEARVRPRPLRVVELGSGDGTLLLRLADHGSASGLAVEATLLDRRIRD